MECTTLGSVIVQLHNRLMQSVEIDVEGVGVKPANTLRVLDSMTDCISILRNWEIAERRLTKYNSRAQ